MNILVLLEKNKKYCTVEEAKAENLFYADLDLKKIWKELEPFISIEQR